jgi:hypothetical protein
MDRIASIATFVFLTASSAWAQTTAPGGGAGGAGAGGTGGGGTGSGGGIRDYWWVILLVLAAIAIWYFMRSRRNRTGV